MMFCWPGGHNRRRRRRNRRPGRSSPSINDILPSYRFVKRSNCPLLEACWQQDWESVMLRLEESPYSHEVFYRTEDHHRTALHLCTMPGSSCPMTVLEALLDCNPHAVVVWDSHQHGGTPVHFVCGSQQRLQPTVIRLLVETAILVEVNIVKYYTTMQQQQQQDWEDPSTIRAIAKMDAWSPFYMACKRGDTTPAETLWLLTQSRRYTQWIAPWTGGETFRDYMASREAAGLVSGYHSNSLKPLGAYLSPLIALWREISIDLDEGFISRRPQLLQQMRDITRQTVTMYQESEMLEMDSLSLGSFSEPTILADTAGNQEDRLVLRAWFKCMILLLAPQSSSYSATSPRLVHLLASLYSIHIPLLRLACLVFPEVGLQPDEYGYTPLHRIILHAQESHWTPNAIHEAIEVMLDFQMASLEVPLPPARANHVVNEAAIQVEDFYPALAAAIQNVSLDSIFVLLRASPQVISMQRRRP